MRETTWRSQVLGPRWETVVRAHFAIGAVERLGAVDEVGVSKVSDRALKRTHEIDMVALRDGRIVALGEAKLRALGETDLARLLRIREMLDVPAAMPVLASATGVRVPPDAPSELVVIEPADIYG